MLYAHNDRARDVVMGQVAQAWETANLTRAKRLPTLASRLAPFRPTKAIDLDVAAAQHEEALAQLAAIEAAAAAASEGGPDAAE